jgi:hypothetical protein
MPLERAEIVSNGMPAVPSTSHQPEDDRPPTAITEPRRGYLLYVVGTYEEFYSSELYLGGKV